MTRQEYLQRPLIEDVVYEIGPDRVYVHSPGCIYIDAKRREIIPLSGIEGLYRQLVKIARNNPRLKIKGVTTFLPAVRALYPHYCESVTRMNGYFSEIVEIAEKLRAAGLHIGYSDDTILPQALKKESAILQLRRRDGAYSRFVDYYNHLQDYLRDKPWDAEGVHYTIVLA